VVQGHAQLGERDSLNMTPEEVVLGSARSKLGLNTCLIATAYGFKRLKRHALLAGKREGAAGEGRDGGVHLPLRTPPPLRSA
jgi:hypothetical protein